VRANPRPLFEEFLLRTSVLVSSSYGLGTTYVAHLNKNADPFPHDDREILSDYENCCIELWARRKLMY
jgi:hypothetical protein